MTSLGYGTFPAVAGNLIVPWGFFGSQDVPCRCDGHLRSESGAGLGTRCGKKRLVSDGAIPVSVRETLRVNNDDHSDWLGVKFRR